MQWRVEGRARTFSRLVNALVAGVSSMILGLLMAGQAAAYTSGAGSIIGATICVNSSAIVLIQPVSDSVVASPSVTLQGTVQQASQIEVRVDGVFDSTIPISIGQTAFSGSVELSQGTHTIMLTAVNSCSGISADTSVVVTYTPATSPQTPSNGSEVPTDAGGVVTQGVTQGIENSATTYNPTVFDDLAQPLQTIAEWLNVGIGDNASQPGIATMHIGQATVIAAGMALAVVGVSPAIVAQAVSLPVISGLLPFTLTPQRILFISRGGRIIGLLLIFGTLFL